MLNVVLSNQFKKDLKLMNRRHVDLEQLESVVNKLANQEVLDERYHDHALIGD